MESTIKDSWYNDSIERKQDSILEEENDRYHNTQNIIIEGMENST